MLGNAWRGTNGLNGALRLMYRLGGQPDKAGPLTYQGLNSSNDGFQYATYTTSYGAAPVVGRMFANAKIGMGATATGYVDIGAEVEIIFPEAALTGDKIILHGGADPNTRVDFLVRYSSSMEPKLIGSKVTNSDGSYRIGTTVQRSTMYIADVNGKSATEIDHSFIEVSSDVRVTATALGDGKVRFTVDGRPNQQGYINIYFKEQRLAHVRSDQKGDAVITVQSYKGRKTFWIYFQTPGCTTGGRSLTGTVQA